MKSVFTIEDLTDDELLESVRDESLDQFIRDICFDELTDRGFFMLDENLERIK